MFGTQLNITFTEGWGQGLSRLGGGLTVGVSLRGHPSARTRSAPDQKRVPTEGHPYRIRATPPLEEGRGTQKTGLELRFCELGGKFHYVGNGSLAGISLTDISSR